LDALIASAKIDFANSPFNPVSQQRLKALVDLQAIIRSGIRGSRWRSCGGKRRDLVTNKFQLIRGKLLFDIDLSYLNRDVDALIASAKIDFANSPFNPVSQQWGGAYETQISFKRDTRRKVVLPNWNDHYWDTGGRHDIDLSYLNRDVDALIASAKIDFANSPFNPVSQPMSLGRCL
jgi:hypothetical protein